MNDGTFDLEAILKRLHLANSRRMYRELIAKAETEQWTYHDFLQTLCAEEVAHRQNTRLQRLTHRARFPFLKTIDEFDWPSAPPPTQGPPGTPTSPLCAWRSWARVFRRISLPRDAA